MQFWKRRKAEDGPAPADEAEASGETASGVVDRPEGAALPVELDDDAWDVELEAEVPLMEMFGYANQLRNLSSGRANYSIEFFKYVPVPKNVQEEVLKNLEEKNWNF